MTSTGSSDHEDELFPPILVAQFVCESCPGSRRDCDMLRRAKGKKGFCRFAHLDETPFDRRKRDDMIAYHKMKRMRHFGAPEVDYRFVRELVDLNRVRLPIVACFKFVQGECHCLTALDPAGNLFCTRGYWHMTLAELHGLLGSQAGEAFPQNHFTGQQVVVPSFTFTTTTTTNASMVESASEVPPGRFASMRSWAYEHKCSLGFGFICLVLCVLVLCILLRKR